MARPWVHYGWATGCTCRCLACASRSSAPTRWSARSAARARLVDRADGFVDLQVWQSDRDPGELIMVSRWRDRAAFTAYMRSAEHRTSHDRIPPELAGGDQARTPRAPAHLRGRRRVSRTAPPSGWPPPAEARLGDSAIALAPLAASIGRPLLRALPRRPRALRRRRPRLGAARHPAPAPLGDRRRRGVRRHGAPRRTGWRGVLDARDFPLEHLAVNLELAAEVVAERVERGEAVAERLLRPPSPCERAEQRRQPSRAGAAPLDRVRERARPPPARELPPDIGHGVDAPAARR